MDELDLEALPHLRGEMRNTQRAGVWTDLYPEVQAARMHLKVLNRQTEYKLQRYAEPFATLAAALGAPYPTQFFELAWRMLLANHAHDAFGGCGMDAVHDETEFRARQVAILADHIFQDATMAFISRIDTGQLDAIDVVLYVLNPHARPQSGVVDVELDFDQACDVTNVDVTDLGGNPTESQLFDKTELLIPFQHPNELPCRLRADRWRAAVEVADVPAMGYKCYVVRAAEPRAARSSIVTGTRSMENEHLAVCVNANGTFDLTHKATGATYPGQNLFHDQGEVGDPWVGAFPNRDRTVTSADCVSEIAILENGPLSGALEIRITMDLPAGCTPDRSARLDETRPVAITSTVRLRKGERIVRVATTVNNCVEDHILRVFFPTSIDADRVQVEMPYDVVSREIEHPDTTGWREPYRPVQPQREFVDISSGGRGFALINGGNGQYEAVDSPQRELALTLLRCFRQWNSVRIAEYPDQTGAQCQGVHTFEYALYPHEGDWVAGSVVEQARQFNVPMKTAVGGPGEGSLPGSLSLIAIDNPLVELTALKPCEWDDSLIVRLVNRTDVEQSATIQLGFDIASAERTNMKETDSLGDLPVRDGCVRLVVAPHRIETVRLRRPAAAA
jgi:hypothetical protein